MIYDVNRHFIAVVWWCPREPLPPLVYGNDDRIADESLSLPLPSSCEWTLGDGDIWYLSPRLLGV